MGKVASFIKHNKNLMVFGLVLAFGIFAPDAFAGVSGQGLKELNTAGQEGRDTFVLAVKGWKWVFGILPFAVAWFIAYKVKDYLEQKDEQAGGQTEPKPARYAKIIAGFIAGIIIMFILYGIFGLVFAGQTEFAKGWEIFVTDFWKLIFT
jgi:hypothetical protein